MKLFCVLFILIILLQEAVAAQGMTSTNVGLDSLIHNSDERDSIRLSLADIAGVYFLNKGFWTESIELKRNGKFKIIVSGCLGNTTIDKGTWKKIGNVIYIEGRDAKIEATYFINRNKQIYLSKSVEEGRGKAKYLLKSANEGKK